MTALSLRARGKASASLVWERYADPALWSSWAPQIQRVETTMTRLEPGGTGTVHAGLLSWPTVPVPFEVLGVDELARTWSWRARVGPLAIRLEHGVAGEQSGSSTWLRVHGPAPVVAAYAPLARFALGRLVAEPPAG